MGSEMCIRDRSGIESLAGGDGEEAHQVSIDESAVDWKYGG